MENCHTQRDVVTANAYLIILKRWNHMEIHGYSMILLVTIGPWNVTVGEPKKKNRRKPWCWTSGVSPQRTQASVRARSPLRWWRVWHPPGLQCLRSAPGWAKGGAHKRVMGPINLTKSNPTSAVPNEFHYYGVSWGIHRVRNLNIHPMSLFIVHRNLSKFVQVL